MTGNEYQKLAMRTNDGQFLSRLTGNIIDTDVSDINVGEIIGGCLGLSGEAGEFNDMIKKWIFHGKELDKTHLKKELGDIEWYVALICHAMGWELDEIHQMNIDKLKARYPDGFSTELANNRKEDDV